MITIFTALYPEAKELIRALSLKKDMTQNHFQVFSDENNQIQIVITGASAIAAATAVAECSTRREPDSGDFLINYGSCAGRKNIPVGTVSLCNKLTQTVDGRTFYPDMIYKNPFKEAEIITSAVLFENKNDKNPQNTSDTVLYDMEAAFVWQAGAYFFAPHEMSFVKILSDNGDTEGITPDYITALVENHINIIDEYINRLRDILDDISCAGDEKAAKEKQLADKLCRDLCCSKTMEYELRQYIRYCFIENIDINGVVCKMYEENMMPCNDKREGKKRFEQLKSRLL